MEKVTKHIYILDALRGFAAVCVMFYHIVFYDKFLDPSYVPAIFKYFYDDSIFSVLIFFVISGAVISINYKKTLTRPTILTYIKKRVKEYIRFMRSAWYLPL